jgi:cytochrome c peroxidase
MKKFIFILILLCFVAGYSFFSCNPKPQPPEKLIAQTLLVQTDSFAGIIRQLQAAVENHSFPQKQMQHLFLQARLAYKRIEWAAEYFESATAKLTNGPPVQEVEMPGLQVIEPAGLQVVEGLIFPNYDTIRKKELLSQLQILQTDCERYKNRFPGSKYWTGRYLTP